MKSKAIIPLVLGLAVGIATVKLAVNTIRKAQAGSQSIELVHTVRAKQDIDPYNEITADNADAELGPLANELKSAITKLDGTLAEAESTLAGASAQIHGDTELARQLLSTLAETESAARSLRIFMDLVERHPEALIQGKQ